MKKVAGTLKLSLAQYRELEAFSQFASDLDEDTKSQLERGKRMVEILKQDVYSPVPFEKQVAIIYAGTNGFLDKINVSDIKKYEKDLYAKLESEKTVLESVRNSLELSDDAKIKLEEIIKEVAQLYS